MAKDLVYVFDKLNNRSSLLGEIQSDFNMSLVIDGTKDSTTIIVWSYSGVEIEPWSIVLHEKTMTWWCVSHDKVERYQNDDGSFVWLHNIELNGAFELLNARDLTDCGFNGKTYTVSDFIHRLFKLSNVEYTLTINAETNFLNKQVDFIKTFENYTLSSALREFLDAYNMCPKITFSYVTSTILAKYALTGINLKIVPKTGNRSRVHQMNDFDDVRETKTMDKNSFGTCVVSNAENVISSTTKTFPSTGSVRLSSTKETITATDGILRLPSNVFKANWLKMYSNGYFIISYGLTQEYVDVNPTSEYSIDNFIVKIQSFITTNVPSIIDDFNSQISVVKEKIKKACCVTLFDGNKIVPYFGDSNNQNGKNIIEKGNDVPYLAKLMLNGGAEKEIILTDIQTRETLNDKKQGVAWERGSNLITGFDFLTGSRGAELTSSTVSLYNDLQGITVYSNQNAGFSVGLRAIAVTPDDDVIYLRYKATDTTFVVNYIPMSDLKIKVDNQKDKRDIQLYNQNGKLTDSVALSKLLNSYSKEISSDTITKYMHYYSYNDVPQVGDIVMDGNVEYVINNVSIDFTQNETSVENDFGYFLDCEITMSKYVSIKSLMANPNTNIRDYGVPQNYNVKRKQLYRDYYELSYYDDANANTETPYLATSKIFNFNHYPNREDNFISVIELEYDDYVENSLYWYYQLETTNYDMSKMLYVVLDFNDNNIIGYGSQNVFSGFDISRIFNGLTDTLNTPISYVDVKGKFKSARIKLCTNEEITRVYDTYQQSQTGGDNYDGSLYNYSVLIPREIYELLGSGDYSIFIEEEDYNKDATEVPVFEYVCQIDDSEYVLIGDNILKQYGSDFVYFYSYVYGDNINQNNAFTTTRVVADGVSGNCSISFASEFSYDPTNKELSVSIWNQSEYDPATNTWQYGTRQNFVRNKDYAIFRHAYNVNTGEEIIDLMLIAKKVQKDDSTNLVLKVNHYKLK